MQPKRDKTKAVLLNAAGELILSEVYGAVSLNDIAPTARLSKGAVYYHFDEKEAPLCALIERDGAEDFLLFETLAEMARRKADDLLERMSLMLLALENILSGLWPPRGSLRSALSCQTAQIPEETRRTLAKSFARITRLLAELFDEILKTYRPVKPVMARTLAISLVAAIKGGAVLARAHGDPIVAARPVSDFRRTLARRFKRRPGPGPSTAPKERRPLGQSLNR
jgi:TetR/AcrR family transcriptional repressor of nem operon